MTARPFSELSEPEKLAEANRRNRARAAGLPLSTPLAEIERTEKLRAGWPFTGEERPGPRRSPVNNSPRRDDELAVHPLCVCTHPAELHDFEKRCTACRCRRYRSREAQHVAAGDQFMRGVGFTVVVLNSVKKSHNTPGVPDRLYVNAARGLGVWWEAKRDGGTRSEAQIQFERAVTGCGYAYVCGGAPALRDWFTRTLEAK